MANKIITITPSLDGKNTQAKLANQGYTYNEAGLTYNQPGKQYGGIYQRDQDIIPTLSLAKNVVPTAFSSRVQPSSKGVVPTVSLANNIKPSIFAFSDIYTRPEAPLGKAGPGWFMYLNLD